MKTKKTIGYIFILLAICVAVGLILIFFNSGKEEIKHTDMNTSSSYIDCVGSQPQNAFFSSDLSYNTSQKVKMTFDNNEINKIAYTYTGEFTNAETAKTTSDQMLFDYNTYMGQQTSYHNLVLSPAFSAVDNKLVVNLFIEKKYFDKDTARLAFLTNDEYSEIVKIDDIDTLITTLKKLYESKTFVCEVKK